jgi:hypothetical protein
MNLFTATALLLLTLLPASAQVELLPGRIPISEAIRWELSMGSIPADSTLYSQPPDYYAQPLIFKRTSGRFKPDATVRYYFSKLDSLPFRIEYRWDPNEPLGDDRQGDSTHRAIEPMSRLDEYEAMYTSLKSGLVSRYGKPRYIVTGGGPEETYPGEHWYKWEGGGMAIDLQMIFSVDASPRGTYRIVVDQTWD